tara:strand:- start:7076 stop:8347 length:1272 start_codon:yes stop_codon:yes gene_type:complete
MRSLRRPMFRRGGKVSSRNNGIVSGFASGGTVRQNYANSNPNGVISVDQIAKEAIEENNRIREMEERGGGNFLTDSNVMMPTSMGTETTAIQNDPRLYDFLSEQGYFDTPEYKRGLTTSDYLRLASMGAEIMGAPNIGGSGLGGALQSASPALASAGRDLSKRYGDRESQYKKDLEKIQDRKIDAIKDDYLFERSSKEARSQADYKHELDMELLDKKLSVPQFEKQFVSQEAKRIRSLMKNLDPDSQEYKDLKADLEFNLYGAITKAVAEGKVELLTNREFLELLDDQVQDVIDSKDPEFSNMSKLQIRNKILTDSFVAWGLENVFVPPGISRENNAEGGRVGLQQGGDPMMAQQTQTQPDSVGLTFEELRARLPQEVTDSVIKLLATSEAALLDFANLETQEDIAQFNQKYNTDLQLPAQVA